MALDPAVARVRTALRRALTAVTHPGDRVLVALSGGADSLALAAATAFEAPKLGVLAGSVTVDHGLLPDSANVADRAAGQANELGLDPVLVRRVDVGTRGGLEAAARDARYAALTEAAATTESAWVLLAHTRDDQAETVLLGLARGSGPRSVAGMRPAARPWLRPFLDVPAATTRAACAARGLTWWEDPHNTDPRFTRVRLRREVLPLLDEVLGGGVPGALARTAALLREDVDALDACAADLAGDLADGRPGVPVDALADRPAGIRRRLLRYWLDRAGVTGLTSAHLTAVDALVTGWRGQGPVALPRGYAVTRRHGRLHVVGS